MLVGIYLVHSQSSMFPVLRNFVAFNIAKNGNTSDGTPLMSQIQNSSSDTFGNGEYAMPTGMIQMEGSTDYVEVVTFNLMKPQYSRPRYQKVISDILFTQLGKTMASVSEAIQALDPNCQFVLHGEPTDAISFNNSFRLVVDVDDDGTAILSEYPNDWERAGITWGTVKK